MNEVKLDDVVNCVDYAFKRIGAAMEMRTYEQVMASPLIVVLPYDEKSVSPGDIVVWDSHLGEINAPVFLTRDGVFITEKRLGNCHFGVVEPGGLVSDYVIDSPCWVRFSHLAQFKPSKIVRIVPTASTSPATS